MRIAAVLLIVILAASTAACGSLVEKKISATDLTGLLYTEVAGKIKNAGFSNVEFELIEDLSSNSKTKDGTVETVSVSGNEYFEDLNSYPK